MYTYLLFGSSSPTTYTWKKYNVVNQYESTSESASAFSGIHSSIKVASSYDLNSSTGVYSLINPQTKNISSSKDEIISTYPYSFLTGAGTQYEGDVLHKLESYTASESAVGGVVWNGRNYGVHLVQHQGTYIEDVTSTNPSAYPDNGIQDGYWYVKQS